MNTQCTTGGGRTGPGNAVGDGTGDDVVVVAGGGGEAARAARRPGASTAPAVGHAGVGLGGIAGQGQRAWGRGVKVECSRVAYADSVRSI